MKKYFLAFTVLIAFLFVLSLAAFADTSMSLEQQDNTAVMELLLSFGGSEISSFNFSLSETPISVVANLQDGKIMASNENNFIVYGLNQDVLRDGIILYLEFEKQDSTRSITFTEFCFASPEAASVSVEVVGGDIAVFFLQAELDATVLSVVDKTSTEGIDANNDDVIDALDIQYIVNRLGE